MVRTEFDEYIKVQTAFILQSIDFDAASIRIHLHGGASRDLPRSAFILYTLGRLIRSGHAPSILTEKRDHLVLLYNRILSAALKTDSVRNIQFVQLYGMRFLHALNHDVTETVAGFAEHKSFAHLFTYPVTTYVFVSAYYECQQLREQFPFAESLHGAALDTLDYVLSSKAGDTYRAFHFAEISAWHHRAPHALIQKAHARMLAQYSEDIQAGRMYASGIAKCLEHWARMKDTHAFARGFEALNARRMSAYKTYLHPEFEKFADSIFSETNTSQYVCLDTSAHLIHAYLNLYEQ